MELASIALQGLQQADVQLGSAGKIASLGGSASGGVNIDNVDLSAEVVALMTAKNQFSAILGTLKTLDEVQRHAIDLMA
jgi:flagellar hook protein FlgE